MGKIVFITEPNLLGNGSFHELQDKLPAETITLYASVQKLINDEECCHPSMIIIDSNKNILRAKDYYSNQNVKIAVWMCGLNREQIKELFSIGFDGYFIYGMSTTEIADGINTILNGRNYIHPKLSSFMFQQSCVI